MANAVGLRSTVERLAGSSPARRTKLKFLTSTLLIRSAVRRLQAVTVGTQDPEILEPVVIVIAIDVIELER